MTGLGDAQSRPQSWVARWVEERFRLLTFSPTDPDGVMSQNRLFAGRRR